MSDKEVKKLHVIHFAVFWTGLILALTCGIVWTVFLTGSGIIVLYTVGGVFAIYWLWAGFKVLQVIYRVHKNKKDLTDYLDV